MYIVPGIFFLTRCRNYPIGNQQRPVLLLFYLFIFLLFVLAMCYHAGCEKFAQWAGAPASPDSKTQRSVHCTGTRALLPVQKVHLIKHKHMRVHSCARHRQIVQTCNPSNQVRNLAALFQGMRQVFFCFWLRTAQKRPLSNMGAFSVGNTVENVKICAAWNNAVVVTKVIVRYHRNQGCWL